jgi:hypothetical protein
MFDKKTFTIFAILPLVLALILYQLRLEAGFKTVTNPDAYAVYNKIIPEKAAEYDSVKKNTAEKFLILNNQNEEASIKISDNFSKVLFYMNKECSTADIKTFDGNIKGYNGVIIAFSELDRVKNIDDYMDYVNRGGNLIFGQRPQDEMNFGRIYRKLGINEKGPAASSEDIVFKTNLLIKGKGVVINEGFTTDPLAVHLSDDCIIYSETGNKLPLIWGREFGKGGFQFVNGDFLTEKSSRGIIAGLLSQMNKAFIYPIINSKVVCIDDFPAPAPEEYNALVYKEFGKSVSNFFRDVWWPDMLKVSRMYNIKYSGFFIETYEASVSNIAQSGKDLKNNNNLITYGSELIKSGGELGLHGYNHQPLAQAGFIKEDLGYLSWPGIKDMADSLNIVNNFIQNTFTNYRIRSYVPPSNILSLEGKKAVTQALPYLKTIASVYFDDSEGDAYVQELEIDKNGIIEQPRFTSGYRMTEFNKLGIYSAVTLHGIFAHFVHPDDVLDSERSGNLGWTEMEKDYTGIMKTVWDDFSWLRANTISEGAVEEERYLENDVKFLNESSSIKGFYNGFREEACCILRTKGRITTCTGCTVKAIDENVYLVNVESPQFSIGLE